MPPLCGSVGASIGKITVYPIDTEIMRHCNMYVYIGQTCPLRINKRPFLLRFQCVRAHNSTSARLLSRPVGGQAAPDRLRRFPVGSVQTSGRVLLHYSRLFLRYARIISLACEYLGACTTTHFFRVSYLMLCGRPLFIRISKSFMLKQPPVCKIPA